MFYILIGVRVTWDFPFVKIVQLKFVHFDIHKCYFIKIKYEAGSR